MFEPWKIPDVEMPVEYIEDLYEAAHVGALESRGRFTYILMDATVC